MRAGACSRSNADTGRPQGRRFGSRCLGVDTNGNDGFKSSVKDVNRDGFADLIVHFNRAELVDDGELTIGTTRLVLYAELADGRHVEARGPVRVGPGASKN